MAKLNLTQAAKAAGIARGTLYRHIADGKVTCEQNGNGERVIDISELLRVYKQLNSDGASQGDVQNPEIEQHETPRDVQIEQVLREQISFLDRQNADLRRDKEKAEEREEKKQAEVDRLTGIIDKQQTLLLPAPKKRGFFGLFGR